MKSLTSSLSLVIFPQISASTSTATPVLLPSGILFRELVNVWVNVPLREASTESLIRELRSRKDLYDYDFNGDKCEHFSEYVYGPKLYVTEENPLGIEIRGYTDSIPMLKKCLRVNDIVYKRVYIPVDMADLTDNE